MKETYETMDLILKWINCKTNNLLSADRFRLWPLDKNVYYWLPVVVLLAKDIPISSKTCEFWIERQLALAALKTVSMPLSVHCQEVVSIMDTSPAASAVCRVQNRWTRGGRTTVHRFAFLQHLRRSRTDDSDVDFVIWNWRYYLYTYSR